MSTHNPHEVKPFVKATSLDYVMDTSELELATNINKAIQDAHGFCTERPRWSSWWDQINRASMSVALNIAQGYGKGRGYFVSDLMIARGEAYEVAAALAIGPKEIVEPLRPLAKELIAHLNKRIGETPDKTV